MGGCCEGGASDQDSPDELGRLKKSIVDQSVWDQLDLSVHGIVGHTVAGIWDRATQGTGLLVEEGLVVESLWGNHECNEQPEESPLKPQSYPDSWEKDYILLA